LFKDAVERRYVHITFVKTGTTVGIPMADASDVSQVDLEKMRGKLKIVGDFVLNYNRVRFHGEINVETGTGTGRPQYQSEFKPSDRAAG
jgi:hypothetical protein